MLLRDYSAVNVEQGQRMIREKNMESFAQFVPGDAFDRSSLAAINPQPTLGVVSGLNELFSENALVRQSLAGLADAIETADTVTGPALASAVGNDRARAAQPSQFQTVGDASENARPEMDQLVEAAGFRKVDQAIDEWGIFTVSLAERV